MGSGRDGVELRGTSIRVHFSLGGCKYRKTLLVNGKPLAPTGPNIKYARRLVAELRDKIRLGVFSMAEYFPASGDGGALTVAGQLDTWLLAQRIEDSTRKSYASAIKFWREVGLGAKLLRALRKSDILLALAQRPALSGKTVNNYMIALRQAIQLAVDDKIITENPVELVVAAAHQKPPPDPFTLDEAERIIARCRKHYPEQVANTVEFWFWTGLRTSELFGLQWANVDLASGTMLVCEGVVAGKRKATTKTNTARTVTLHDRAIAALQAQRKHTQLQGCAVFHDPRYGADWCDERAFRRSYWTPALKVLGIRYRRPYTIRHTCATVMLMRGMNPAFCAGQLGHSVEMFLRTYAKWIGGDRDALEMARFNDAGPKQETLKKVI